MDRLVFHTELVRRLKNLTFAGHRVNDTYTLNKRRAIEDMVMSAFDEAQRQLAVLDGTAGVFDAECAHHAVTGE